MASYGTYDDAALLLQLKQGDDHSDQSAFREIYDRYMEKLYRSACRKLASPEQAEEIVHDVLLDLWKRRTELDIEYLPAYLEKAVRFKVINYVNRGKLPRFMEVFESLLFSPYTADSAFKDEAFNQLLESWVETLPEKQRAIFVRHYVDGLSTREIAIETGLAHKTVQNNLSLSVQYLRTRFGHLLMTIAILEAFSQFID